MSPSPRSTAAANITLAVTQATFTCTRETRLLGEIRLKQQTREQVYMHHNNMIIVTTVFKCSRSVSAFLQGYILSQDCIFKCISDFSFWTLKNCFLFWSEHLDWWCDERLGSEVGEYTFLDCVHASEFYKYPALKRIKPTYLFQVFLNSRTQQYNLFMPLHCCHIDTTRLSVSREGDLSSGGWVTQGHRHSTQTNGDELRHYYKLAWISIAGSLWEAAVHMLIALTGWAKRAWEIYSSNWAESCLYTAPLFGDKRCDNS